MQTLYFQVENQYLCKLNSFVEYTIGNSNFENMYTLIGCSTKYVSNCYIPWKTNLAFSQKDKQLTENRWEIHQISSITSLQSKILLETDTLKNWIFLRNHYVIKSKHQK